MDINIIVEKRGKNEDGDLELAFRGICEGKRFGLWNLLIISWFL
jgi:hypothetical protein